MNSVLTTPGSNDTIVMYTNENPRSYYESDYDKLHELMDEATAWAIDENHIPDNMNYDANGDGVIDCVTFIFAGMFRIMDREYFASSVVGRINYTLRCDYSCMISLQ